MTVVATIPKRIGRAMSPGKAPINTGPVVANSSHRDVIRALQHSRGVRGLNPKAKPNPRRAGAPAQALGVRPMQDVIATREVNNGRKLRRASSVPLSPPSPSIFRDTDGKHRSRNRDGFWEDAVELPTPKMSREQLNRTARLSSPWRPAVPGAGIKRRKQSLGDELHRTYPQSPYAWPSHGPALALSSTGPNMMPRRPSGEFEAFCKRSGWHETSQELPECDGRIGRPTHELAPMASMSQRCFEKSMALARWQIPQHLCLGWKRQIPVEEVLHHRPLVGLMEGPSPAPPGGPQPSGCQPWDPYEAASRELPEEYSMGEPCFAPDGFLVSQEWGEEYAQPSEDEELEEPEGLVVVRNLPRKCNADKLRAMFEQHGEVADVHIPRNRVLSCNREFAFVKMAKLSEAEIARQELNGMVVHKQEIEVVLGHERRTSPPLTHQPRMSMANSAMLSQGNIPIASEANGRLSPLSSLASPPTSLSGRAGLLSQQLREMRPEHGKHLVGHMGGVTATAHTGLTPRVSWDQDQHGYSYPEQEEFHPGNGPSQAHAHAQIHSTVSADAVIL